MASKKRSTASAAKSAPAVPAQKPDVTLNLAQFSPISSGQYCTLGNSSNPPLLITRQGQGNGIYYLKGNSSNNGISLSKGSPIVFSVDNYDGNSADVAIVGCILLPKSGAPVADNFNKISWDPDFLTIHATHKDKSESWKLFVAITATVAGQVQLGIIDPDIENDATPFVPPAT